jgi:hypothetical protein
MFETIEQSMRVDCESIAVQTYAYDLIIGLRVRVRNSEVLNAILGSIMSVMLQICPALLQTDEGFKLLKVIAAGINVYRLIMEFANPKSSPCEFLVVRFKLY